MDGGSEMSCMRSGKSGLDIAHLFLQHQREPRNLAFPVLEPLEPTLRPTCIFQTEMLFPDESAQPLED